jgi:hypothetical protein
VVAFDMRGHKLDTVEIAHPVRFYDAAHRGLFVVSSRRIMYISRDQTASHIDHSKSNITGFSVIDDNRFCITTNTRLMLCEPQGSKHVFRSIAKLRKKALAIKCYASKVEGPVDMVIVVYDDASFEQCPLPSSCADE